MKQLIANLLALLSRQTFYEQPVAPVAPPVPPVPPHPAPEPPKPVEPPKPSYNDILHSSTLFPEWDTVEKSRHNVRAICDQEGLTLTQKNELCATVGAESGWQSYYLSGPQKGKPVIKENRSPNGKVWSTDYGIAQINTHYHIGPGKSFPSSKYVLDNPEACIRWMCKQWKAGNAKWWVAYLNGSFRRFL